MFKKEFQIDTWHMRRSKLGKQHTYSRKKRMCLFECDSCGEEFSRLRGSMDPKRISNHYYHVCENCDVKRFAQSKGVERKRVWSQNAASDWPINKA